MYYPYFLKKIGYEPQCDLSLFVLLRSGNVSEWNAIRAKNNYNEVYLQACTVGISNLDLNGINLSNTHFEGATFQNVNLENADLTNAHFEGAELVNVFFDYGAKIKCSHFEGSTLEKFINEFHHLPFCSYSQYKLLIECSEKKDSSGWNEWRKKRPWEKIYLQKIVFLKEGYLNDINFSFAHLEAANFNHTSLVKANFNYAYLEGASLNYAHIEESRLYGSHLNKATLEGSYLNNAFLGDGIFEGANLESAHLEGAKISGAKFIGANLCSTDLSNARLWEVDLEGACFGYAILEGTSISGFKKKSTLKNTDFTGTSVNGKTIIQYCDIDKKTNFTLVNLDSARVEPSLLAALKTNIRRIAWEKYYKKQGKSFWGKIKRVPIYIFWCLSDYGSNTVRIFKVFLGASVIFTLIYLAIAYLTPETAVLSNLRITGNWWLNFISALCFAVSTMVTLGFGGINVTIQESAPWATFFALFFVTFNLMIGYFILAVLVTRLGILFQSLAPEQKIKKE